MAQSGLLIEFEAPVAVVTLNRPERRNALALDLIEELILALEGIAEHSSLRVVILAAAGPAFCSGHDLRELQGGTAEEYRRLFDSSRRLMRTLHAMPQPVIAQVQGTATAAGCQLVAACDLAVAAESASFATPGVRIGLFCSTPMVPLVRAVGRKRAFEMLATGEPIDARTAAAWGLVNRVVPDAELKDQTRRLALQIAQAPRSVLASGKRAFYTQLDWDEAQAYAYASQVMAQCAETPEAQEGIAAFLEKRPPVWRE